jgi:lysophospholipid acyltransferase (LPLAT)-like uncharacterized protein
MARRKRWYQTVIDWLFFYVGVPFVVFALRLLYATIRWEVRGRENLRPFWDEGHPVIIAFWHGRLILMPHQWERKGNAHVLIGTHRNGELIARVIAPFGIGAVRGSSNRGGKAAREQMSEAFFQGGGQTLGFTPDGPHGPRYVSKIGMAHLSRKLGIPVVWLNASATPALRAPTWDKFMIPLPFSKVIINWAPPIEPAQYAHLDLEGYRQLLDQFGRQYLREADKLLGRDDPDDTGNLANA